MSKLDAWDGLLSGSRTDEADVTLVMPDPNATQKNRHSGGSKPLLGRADDGNRYWVKPLNNPQGPKVPVTEQIVGRIGLLIDAPVCEVRTIEIPDAIAQGNWKYAPNQPLEPGIAHASQNVGNANEQRGSLSHYNDDRNSQRFPYFLALYDWCWGGDAQWLYVESDDNQYYSHDHGWYLPPKGATWTKDAIQDKKDEPHVLQCQEQNLESNAVEEVVGALQDVDRNDILATLSTIPTSWNVTDEGLEAVGYFLENRAPQVADRLTQRFQL